MLKLTAQHTRLSGWPRHLKDRCVCWRLLRLQQVVRRLGTREGNVDEIKGYNCSNDHCRRHSEMLTMVDTGWCRSYNGCKGVAFLRRGATWSNLYRYIGPHGAPRRLITTNVSLFWLVSLISVISLISVLSLIFGLSLISVMPVKSVLSLISVISVISLISVI